MARSLKSSSDEGDTGTFQHLDAWQHSAIRADHLAAGSALFDDQVRRQQMVGIGFISRCGPLS
jgi:hypothetical protein